MILQKQMSMLSESDKRWQLIMEDALLIVQKSISVNELQSAALEHVRRFQILDESSPLYGAYANTETMDAYSFDNHRKSPFPSVFRIYVNILRKTKRRFFT